MRFLILNTTKWRQLATNCEEFETIIHKNLIEKLIYNIQFLCVHTTFCPTFGTTYRLLFPPPLKAELLDTKPNKGPAWK